MINVDQLREFIKETLNEMNITLAEGINKYLSDDIIELLIGTASAESLLGTYLWQIPKGPALGLYQMEPATHDDIWVNYIIHRHALEDGLHSYFGMNCDTYHSLVYNLAYSTWMARLHYYRVKEPLPDYRDVIGMAKYWKKHYNTEKGKGTESHFIQCYEKHVLCQ